MYVNEEIKVRLKSVNASCHSVLNPFSSSLQSKTIMMKIQRTVIFPVVCMVVNLGLSH